MGRITEPSLQSLATEWNENVRHELNELGKRRWPPFRESQGLFQRPRIIDRFVLEGPIQRGGELVWSISHTSRPSTFDDNGNLTEGRRECWILAIAKGSPVAFRLEGLTTYTGELTNLKELKVVLERAYKEGPRQDNFYGNKGPLSHR
jgi:hypothetical protein